ncbi:MAG: aspartate-semialdehyde dehydrogenase [Myxococcota bacterium]|jgi:aspartate-semialdehyde dehydrogenase
MPKVAIVGATGAVGLEIIGLLEQRQFPVTELLLYASGRSAGDELPFEGRQIKIQNLASADFKGVDFAFFAAGSSISKEFAPKATEAGAVVIDKSSAFRMDPDVPLIVPEVNGDLLNDNHRLIASPNCSTIPLVMVLWPLHQAHKIKRVVVSTYQAVSGAGRAAGDELVSQVVAMLNHQPMEVRVFPHQMAFNVLPHVETFSPSGYSTEEEKIIEESRKVMGLADLRITATAVRVPVLNGHSESINIEFENAADPDQVREILKNAPGIQIMDDPVDAVYPMPLEASGRDEVLVGRIRKDLSVDFGINLWLSADNLRKGAGLNAIQIAEQILKIHHLD